MGLKTLWKNLKKLSEEEKKENTNFVDTFIKKEVKPQARFIPRIKEDPVKKITEEKHEDH